MNEQSISVIIADDHPLVLRGIVDLIASEPHFHIVAVANEGASALAAILTHNPQLAILDLSMPPPGALEILRKVSAAKLQVRSIILTASITSTQVVEAVAAGVYAILLKESAPEELVDCMLSVMKGRRTVPADLVEERIVKPAKSDLPHAATIALTSRKSEVAWLVSEGLSNKEIARRLTISEGTVKIHLHNIYGKLQVKNRTRLAGLTRGLAEG